ncbi:hypothetical protein EVAR_89199_1 [Eumeta japonica]|uniref:Uncharacterized protein n=1 Tax=Eumeta variegata TaxID=151549 RepID=A0A4C1YFW3_EUMVA|nr:hypothetical protein EVAR_89199_1 [Eumeta japonica]
MTWLLIKPDPAKLPNHLRGNVCAFIIRSQFRLSSHSSGCSTVAIDHLRSSPLDHPFSLVCYCVSVFLRTAFWSVGLRVCMNVCGAAQCTSRGDSQATCIRPGDILRLPHRLRAEPAHGFYA